MSIAIADLDGLVDLSVHPGDFTRVNLATDVVVEIGLVLLHRGQGIVVQTLADYRPTKLVYKKLEYTSRHKKLAEQFLTNFEKTAQTPILNSYYRTC